AQPMTAAAVASARRRLDRAFRAADAREMADAPVACAHDPLEKLNALLPWEVTASRWPRR
ncbi:hypothetical protein, partial [Mesorhizobium sp. SARCC-RB16n]|uniref:hypothetical protein n=1 Tax=Mesorhizobium sp. SARCC-RB16n TaxID=2116687 RepID=UPI001AEEC9A8